MIRVESSSRLNEVDAVVLQSDWEPEIYPCSTSLVLRIRPAIDGNVKKKKKIARGLQTERAVIFPSNGVRLFDKVSTWLENIDRDAEQIQK